MKRFWQYIKELTFDIWLTRPSNTNWLSVEELHQLAACNLELAIKDHAALLGIQHTQNALSSYGALMSEDTQFRTNIIIQGIEWQTYKGNA